MFAQSWNQRTIDASVVVVKQNIRAGPNNYASELSPEGRSINRTEPLDSVSQCGKDDNASYAYLGLVNSLPSKIQIQRQTNTCNYCH